MKKVLIFITCCCAIIALQCKEQTAPDTRSADEASILQADMEWANHSTSLEGHLTYFLDDAVVLPPNEPLLSGKEAIRKSLSAMYGMPGFSVTWKANKADVAKSGDLGYSMGNYELVMNDSTGMQMKDTGKYISVWKKQSDGKWMVSADMFSSDMPMH